MKKRIPTLILVLIFLTSKGQANDTSAVTTVTDSVNDRNMQNVLFTLKHIDNNLEEIKNKVIEKPEAPLKGQSIFEDRKGESAIFLPNGGTLRLNTADASIKLSFAHRVSTKKPFLGFDISGKTNDGLLTLFSKGMVSPGVKINGVVGIQELFHKSNILDGWLALQIGYEGSSFKLFKPDSVFKNQIEKINFNTFRTSVDFNLKMGGNKLLGVSIGYRKANNYEDLDKIELTDTRIIQDSVSNTTRTYTDKINVRSGLFETFHQVPLKLDFYWTTKNNNPRIGFYHYWRTTINVSGKVVNGFGSGIYLLKKNNPLSSIAGITFEVNDVTKLKDGFGKGFTVNFLVAYNFDFAKRNLH